MIRRILYLPLVLGLILLSCEETNDTEMETEPAYIFEYSGLDGRIVYELSESTIGLVAATDNGLYLLEEGQADWSSLGLSDKNIRTFVELSPDYWLVAENISSSFNLYLSQNMGEEWNILENDFGGMYEQHINDFEYDPDTNLLYACGYAVVAESADRGQTWTPLIGAWDLLASGLDFVEKHPDEEVLWSGGQNAIEEFVLYKYNLKTEDETFYQALVASPSVPKSILFDDDNPDHIIIGAEGGIISTNDRGETWTLIRDDHENSKFTFGLARDEFDRSTIYAAGWLKDFDNPQELVLSVSPDEGDTWRDIVYDDDELFGGVFDMLSVMEWSAGALPGALQGWSL